MRDRREFVRRPLLLAAAALLVFGTGGLIPAYGDQAPSDESVAPPSQESLEGGCCGRGSDGGGCCQGRGKGTGGCGKGRGGGRGVGTGMAQGRMGGPGGRHAGGRQPMEAIHALVHEYRDEVVREVEEIDDGVVTITRIPGNVEAISVLQRHVSEMKGLLEGGGRLRAWDPLFSEIFDHYSEIEMEVELIEDGVRVVETSANPEVAKLIRAHAHKVNDFVARGPAAVHERTPLPDDYRTGDDR